MLASAYAAAYWQRGPSGRRLWSLGGRMDVMAARSQKPLELILARNLLTSISTPAFLLDHHGALVFYNEAAGAVLGRSFEDAGRMDPEQWISTYGPLDGDGKPIPLDELPGHPSRPRGPAGARRLPAAFGERNGPRN